MAISWPQVSDVVPVASSTTEKIGEREGRRVEDVDPLAVAVPAHERLAGKPEGDQDELPDRRRRP